MEKTTWAATSAAKEKLAKGGKTKNKRKNPAGCPSCEIMPRKGLGFGDPEKETPEEK